MIDYSLLTWPPKRSRFLTIDTLHDSVRVYPEPAPFDFEGLEPVFEVGIRGVYLRASTPKTYFFVEHGEAIAEAAPGRYWIRFRVAAATWLDDAER